MEIGNYEIQTLIYESQNSLVYQGRRTVDQRPVILKVLKADYPTSTELRRFKQEYRIISGLDLPGVIKVYEMQPYHKTFMIVFEDFGGRSLNQLYPDGPLPLGEFLTLAIKITEGLGEIHQANIIHKDINPSNITLNPISRILKIIDFGIATQLNQEHTPLKSPNVLEGTLAYLSPEQTGRMNRSVDYRTDFYALGVTFYQLLTGQLPFNSPDPLELVHYHLAQDPLAPHQVNPNIPLPLSHLVMKLMAKVAEDRYQSAAGIRHDLEGLQRHLTDKNKVNINRFEIGCQDRSSKFQIPQKLYGREPAIATLLETFNQVTQGSSTLMLVTGYAGTGKTSLVQEIYKPITEKRGYFISGKFDHLQRNPPYSAVVAAFRSLVQQLLTEPEERLNHWRDKLLQSLGKNGQVIIDVIPEIKLIIGDQPALAAVDPIQSQNRFRLVFSNFVHTFCSESHPLVIFLDDLQWADYSSLQLIELLITDPDTQYLLLIGAYRDQEVNVIHPWMRVLQAIEKQGKVPQRIELEPLNLAQVTQLIAETLQSDRTLVTDLAALTLTKTDGNPFFVQEFLKTLYSKKLLLFNPATLQWQWDLQQIKTLNIADNVVELMIAKIKQLPEMTQQILKQAACLGATFDLSILTAITHASSETIFTHLKLAIEAGLVIPISELDAELVIQDYQFSHDRIQQAAYQLLNSTERQSIHWQIGQFRLEEVAAENLSDLSDRIFQIIDHLNLGWDANQSQEQSKLAELNLLAGQKASMAMAYHSAIEYLETGLNLLPDDRWQTAYQQTLSFYQELSQAEYLNGNLERAGEWVEVILSVVKSPLDRVKPYKLKIGLYTAQNQLSEAIHLGFEAVENLGISIQRTGTLEVDLPDLNTLATLPQMNAVEKLAALEILLSICPPALYASPPDFQAIILTMLDLCQQHGYSALAAGAYAWYSWLCSNQQDIDKRYQASQIALRLAHQYNSLEFQVQAKGIYGAVVQDWKNHARQGVVLYKQSYQQALESGSILYATSMIKGYYVRLFFTGEPLEILELEIEPYWNLLIKLKNKYAIYQTGIWRQVSQNLVNPEVPLNHLSGPYFNEQEILPELIQSQNRTVLCVFYLAKLYLAYLFGDYATAEIQALEAAQYTEAVGGLDMYVAIHNFYYSLTLLQLASAEDAQKLARVNLNQRSLKYWATHAPMNFQHKYDLVEAEKCRVLERRWRAAELYEKAIQGAANYQYVQEQALANELAASFYLNCGMEKIGQAYLSEARYDYSQWQAWAKVYQLEFQYADFFKDSFLPTAATSANPNKISTSSRFNSRLDVETLIKASQVISREIVLDKLLQQLMKILLENVGAERGFLIFKSPQGLCIEAEGNINSPDIWVRQSVAVKDYPLIAKAIVNYVTRTRETVVLSHAAVRGHFLHDPYIQEHQPKSILCAPLLNQGRLIGVIYLENNLAEDAFTQESLQMIQLLSGQAAIAIENAQLYNNLEHKVAERTAELTQTNMNLAKTLSNLKRAQIQLIQTEKMSSLGQMVAGIAHEINNPVNFIYGNITPAESYVKDLCNLIELYRQAYPNATAEIETAIAEIDLDFVLEDLEKILQSIKTGSERIQKIVLSLRTFSRLDEAAMKPIDIHDGIESTLAILQHRLHEKPGKAAIEVQKNYGKLPQVTCYALQLNQVFMNILVNACDALEDLRITPTRPPKIVISTELTLGNTVKIAIADNGEGMSSETRAKIFDPFFTTKPVGRGTGLGLSISYAIIEHHHGRLSCVTALGEGTTLTIEIPISPPQYPNV